MPRIRSSTSQLRVQAAAFDEDLPGRLHGDVQFDDHRLLRWRRLRRAGSAHIEHSDVGRQPARNLDIGAIDLDLAGDLHLFPDRAFDSHFGIQVGRHDVVRDGLRVFGGDLQVNGHLGCSTPIVPVIDTFPGAARAVSFSMRNKPWLPLNSPVMSDRLMPCV